MAPCFRLFWMANLAFRGEVTCHHWPIVRRMLRIAVAENSAASPRRPKVDCGYWLLGRILEQFDQVRAFVPLVVDARTVHIAQTSLRRRLLGILRRSLLLGRLDVLPWLPAGAIEVVRALAAVTDVPAFVRAAIGRAGVPGVAAGSVRIGARTRKQDGQQHGNWHDLAKR